MKAGGWTFVRSKSESEGLCSSTLAFLLHAHISTASNVVCIPFVPSWFIRWLPRLHSVKLEKKKFIYFHFLYKGQRPTYKAFRYSCHYYEKCQKEWNYPCKIAQWHKYKNLFKNRIRNMRSKSIKAWSSRNFKILEISNIINSLDGSVSMCGYRKMLD